MDITEKLPGEYFYSDSPNSNLESEDLYDKFIPDESNDFENVYDLSLKNDNEIAETESDITTNPVSNNEIVANDSIINKTPEEQGEDFGKNANLNTNISPNDDIVLEQIKNLDDKLFSLEKKLQNIKPESTENTNLNVQNRDENLVTRNFFKKDDTSENSISNIDTNILNNEINPDYVENDSVFNSFNTSENTDNESQDNSIVEVSNNKSDVFKNSIENEIKNLFNTRKELIQKLNKKQNYNTLNTKSYSESFVPNFQYNTIEENDEIKESLLTEKIFNNNSETKVVADSMGSPAVIGKDQINLQSAIEEHGGLENALTDSMEQQSFVNSFINDNKKSNSNSNNFFNNTLKEETSNVEKMPNNFTDISKNTSETVVAIREMSKNLNSFINSLNKNFGNLNSSIKDIKSSQSSIVNNIVSNKNFNNSENGNNMSSSDGGNSNIIPNLRTNSPLSQDFPPGVIPGGTNLANRGYD